jgi:predicted lipoprotein with Yx(FWY)xxD motif
MTLYTFGPDKEGTCTGKDLEGWRPYAAPPGAQPQGDWAVADHDGPAHWAYKGKCLYNYSGDTKPGDANGEGVGEAWHLLFEPLVPPPGITIFADRLIKTLADARGMTLYVFDKDPSAGQPKCVGKCLEYWTALPAPAIVNAEAPWSVVSRGDGTNQWAFKGKPLYISMKDGRPGDRNGEGLDGTWHAAVVRERPVVPPGVTIQMSGTEPVLADHKGLTLYAFFNPADRLKMVCDDACMSEYWQPALALPETKPGGPWSTFKRADGALQWVYKGKPLYTYTRDKGPGETKGQDFGHSGGDYPGLAWQPVRPS